MKIKYLILLLLVASLLSGVASAQERALPDPGLLPGSPFYFLDSLFESLGSLVTFGNIANAERHLALAEKRLAEAKALADKGDSNRAERATQNYEERIAKAVERAEKAKVDDKDTDAIFTKIAEATLRHQEILSEVYEKVPEQAKEAIKRAMENSLKGHNAALEAVSGNKRNEDETEGENQSKTELLKPTVPKTIETPKPTIKTIEPVTTTPPPAISQSPCSRTFSPKFSQAQHYLGPLFDAHLHMPDIIDISKIDTSSIEGHDDFPIIGHGSVNTDAELTRLLCVFEQEKIRGAFGFVMGEEQLLNETIAGAKSTKAKVGNKVNLFLSPAGFTAAGLEKIEISNKGLLDGYGELSFGFGGGQKSNQSPDDQNFLDIYKVAGKSNLIVMIHVGAQQQSRIENILQKNPNVKFLFHGPESENFIHNVIGKYPNAYYSIDAMLIRLPGSPGALMYTVNSKDKFKTKFSQNYKTMLDNTVNQWKSKVEQYPDRYVWGTDRYGEWTYDEDVGALIEEFGRAFIGRIDPAVQERFAYKNAENLLSK